MVVWVFILIAPFIDFNLFRKKYPNWDTNQQLHGYIEECAHQTQPYQDGIEILKENPISRHELRLVFNYILWSIDNRSWMQDNHAYLKWITHSSGNITESEKKNYEKEIRKLCDRLDLGEDKVNQILYNQVNEEDLMDEDISITESEFFALEDDNERFDYITKNFFENPYLFQTYCSKLVENNQIDRLIELHIETLKNVPDFPPLELSLAELYLQTGKKVLAYKHCSLAKETMKKMPKEFIPDDEKEKYFELIEEILKKCE